MMEDEYVRKDYHDATMREIKALMDRNLAKQEAMNAEMNARIDAMAAKQETLYTEIRGEIKNIHTRIDGVVDTFSVAINDLKDRIDDVKDRVNDIETGQSNALARWGIAIAVFVGIMQVAVAWFMK